MSRNERSVHNKRAAKGRAWTARKKAADARAGSSAGHHAKGAPIKKNKDVPDPPSELAEVLAGGAFKVTLVIGGELSGLQLWDVGREGTPEEPVLVAGQGYMRTCPMTHKGLVKNDEWEDKVRSGVGRRAGPLCEALEDLLYQVTDVMRELRRTGPK